MEKKLAFFLCLFIAKEAWGQGLFLRADRSEEKAGYQGKIALELNVPSGVDAVPRFYTSAGRIEGPERVGPNWKAWLALPEVRHPLLVLVAAKVPGYPPAWTTVRLHAPVKLPVRTDKPRVEVTLVLGGRQYGPVRTDDEGNCIIEAEVWPGELEGKAHGVDEFGNKTQEKVVIPIPSYPLTLAIAEQESVAADGQSTLDLWVVQVNPDGKPVDRAQYSLRLGSGKLLDTVRKGPGVFRSRIRAPRGRQSDRLVCEVIDKRQSPTGVYPIEVSLTSGMPHSIRVTLEPAQLFSDGKSQTLIRLQVLDKGENPVAGHLPRIECPSGTLGEIKVDEESYLVYYLPESGLEGKVTCRATVSEGVRADFSLTLKRPRVALLEANAQSNRLIADGSSQLVIYLRALGDNGQPLAGAKIDGKASVGKLSSVVDEGEGRYHAVYTAPLATGVEKVRLEFTAEGPQGPQVAWLVIHLEPPPAPLPAAPRLIAGMGAGLSLSLDQLYLPAFYLEALYRLPFGSGLFYTGLHGGYLFDRSQRQARQEGIAQALVELDVQQLMVLVQARLRNRSVFLPFVEAGVGSTFFSWRIKPEGTSERGSEIALLVLAGVGGELRFGSGAFFLLARYSWTRFSEDELERYLNGNLAGFQVLAGLRYFVF